MENQHLLARLDSIDGRLAKVEEAMVTVNHELGILCGKVKNNAGGGTAQQLIRYVIFPLIVITGALVGVKLA